jgi:hypothetical protein
MATKPTTVAMKKVTAGKATDPEAVVVLGAMVVATKPSRGDIINKIEVRYRPQNSKDAHLDR